jgi:hypothetical protein
VATSDTPGCIARPTSRREALLGFGVLAAKLLLTPARLWAAANAQAAGPHRALLEALCDLVIPTTDTPGAVAAGVPAFVELAVSHGLRDSDAQLLSDLATALDTAAGGAFLSLGAEPRAVLLADIDHQVFSQTATATSAAGLGSWATLKALIVIGYYTSEIGGSQELRYQLVPGRFEPDVPVGSDERAWSSDWTGVKYG